MSLKSGDILGRIISSVVAGIIIMIIGYNYDSWLDFAVKSFGGYSKGFWITLLILHILFRFFGFVLFSDEEPLSSESKFLDYVAYLGCLCVYLIILCVLALQWYMLLSSILSLEFIHNKTQDGYVISVEGRVLVFAIAMTYIMDYIVRIIHRNIKIEIIS